MDTTDPEYFGIKETLNRCRELLESGPLCASIFGGGIQSTQSVQFDHVVLVSRQDLKTLIEAASR